MKRAAILLVTVLALAACSKPAPSPPPPVPAPQQEAPQPPPTPAPVPPPPPEPPRGVLEPAQVLQGDLAVVRLDRPVGGDVTVRVDGLEEQPKVYYTEGRASAFVGFPAAARPGSYPVTIAWPGGQWEGAFEVVRKAFTEDRLVVTEQQQAIYYDPRQAEEWRRVFALRSTSQVQPLWTGPFRAPLDGDLKITTYFGEIRFVNGKETGRHSGMDFGAPTGTPILAPAPGRVILAEKLIVTGWTIIIDHGYNLFTTYYHCDSLDVKPGDEVTTGDIIGRVGNTGFSTGPHLHWTATIGNTPVNPWPLTESAPMGIRAPHPFLPE